MTDSLAFRLLDRHVVEGRADEPALVDGTTIISFADLLHDAASLARGLAHVGIGAEAALAGGSLRTEVTSLLALVRLGTAIEPSAAWTIGGDPARVLGPEVDEDWEVVLRSGRVDPHPAARQDPDGWADTVLVAYGDLLAPLFTGRPITSPA